MPQKSTKHKAALQPSKDIDLLPKPGKATGWTMPKAKKPKDTPRPAKKVARDPASRNLVLVKPKARSTTVPQKSTKPKDGSKFFEKLVYARDSKGQQRLIRSKPPSTTKTPSLTKHKDAGYDKSKGRATHCDRAGIMTEGSVVEEAADDGGAAGPEAAEREDSDDEDSDDGDSVNGSTTDENSDDGQTDEEDTDDEDAVGVHSGGRGPAAMGSVGGDNGGQHVGYRVVVEEELTEARPARRLAARRDNATTPTAGVEAPTRDSSERYLGSTDLVIRNSRRDRRDDARGYAADREGSTRESRERGFGGSELVRRDHGRPHPQYGAPRMVPVESILERMPPLEVGDDNFVANRNRVLDPVSIQLERYQRLAPEEGWEVARDWSAEERAVWEIWNIAGQREAQQMRYFSRQRQEEQRYGGQHQGQGYQGQGYQGQGYYGQVGQGSGGQNATRTMVVRSRDDPRDDPPPAYTPYDQTYTGSNRYH